MAELALLTLRLHAALRYRGFENPPFTGIGVPGASSGAPDGALLDSILREGAEELFVFDEAELVTFDPDGGPFAADSLPAPSFHGHGLLAAETPEPGEASYALPAGDYLFLQWRPRDEKELRAGIEYFTREAWWEGHRAKGPFLLRRVFEDGGLATQLLRSLASPST